jgi:hypothetical protein
MASFHRRLLVAVDCLEAGNVDGASEAYRFAMERLAEER